MQEKSLKNARNLLMQDIRSNTTYFAPVVRNGWIIKFSVYQNTDILLVLTSKYTGQTILRYFAEEDHAVKFINMVIARDASVYQDNATL
jgi:hypothetical protein